MRLAVRLDDIAEFCNWENLERMMGLLKEKGAMPLLGIIPECRDESIKKSVWVTEKERAEFADRVREYISDGAVISMHGVYHVYTTNKGGIFPLNKKSEFAGLSGDEQRELLDKGLEAMKGLGLETDIFMAPSHSYDRETLAALKEKGFKKVTDGFGNAPYRYKELTFFPIAVSKDRAAASKKPGTATVVYHVNTMSDNDFSAAEKLFDSADMIPYSALLAEPTVRRPEVLQTAERIMAAGKRIAVGMRSRKQ